MTITDRNIIVPLQGIGTQPDHAPHGPRGGGRADRISLSGEALAMKRATLKRVAALTRAIIDGEYHIDLERLAEAFVGRELL